VDRVLKRPDAVGEGDSHDEAGNSVEDDSPNHCPWENARCIADLLSYEILFVSIVGAVLGCGMELTHMHGGIGSDQRVDRSCQANEARQTNGGPTGRNREVHPNISAWGPWRKYPEDSSQYRGRFKFIVRGVNKPKWDQDRKEAANMKNKH
jgi:hypothetical protein